MTAVNKSIVKVIIFAVFIATVIGIFNPQKEVLSNNLNIGAGTDISGIILSETMEYMDKKDSLVGSMEFGDC